MVAGGWHRSAHQLMLWLGGSTGCRDLAPFPRGVNAWASSLSSLSCISRNIKVLKKKIKKKIQSCSRWLTACETQTPKARLKALARPHAINSNTAALFLLDRIVTFPSLSLTPYHLCYWFCPLWKKFLLAVPKGRSGSRRAGAAWNGLKLWQDFSGACPAHSTVSGVLRHCLEPQLHGRSKSCSQSFHPRSREIALAKSALVHSRD